MTETPSTDGLVVEPAANEEEICSHLAQQLGSEGNTIRQETLFIRESASRGDVNPLPPWQESNRDRKRFVFENDKADGA